MYFKRKKTIVDLKSGFTLVELLVAISIFTIITGVVLMQDNSFSSGILTSNMAYETALTIRQAQVYGVNVKATDIDANNINTQSFDYAYGVHIGAINDAEANTLEQKNLGIKSVKLFVDIDEDARLTETNNSGDLCSIENECLENTKFSKNNYIKNLCYVDYNSSFIKCGKTLSFLFKRPDLDAKIYADRVVGGGEKKYEAYICVANPQGDIKKIVVVSAIGQISIQDYKDNENKCFEK